MSGTPVTLGPFIGGLHNSSGTGEYIDDAELYSIVNLEVDTDGSLANRPAVYPFVTLGAGSYTISTFVLTDGRTYIVTGNGVTGEVSLIDTLDGSKKASNGNACGSVACTQYDNKLWVVPIENLTTSTATGGYFDDANPPAWHAVGAIPRGEAAIIYKERMFVAAGKSATADTSRVSFSAIGAPQTWGPADFIDVEPGNGQKLISLLVLNNDLLLFKEHSTYRAGYTSDIAKTEVSKISSTIGVPAPDCAVTFDNNNVYLLHDNTVYELFNYTFTPISVNLRLEQNVDPTMYAWATYGLTLFRNRLFVRYFSSLYVYSLKTHKWSEWITENNFSKLVVIPSDTVGLDLGFASAATSVNAGKLFEVQDSRTINIDQEDFQCSIQTKTYDFTLSYAFKVMFMWGMTISTSGTTVGSIKIPNAGKNYTWNQLKAKYASWNIAALDHAVWSNADQILYSKSVPSALGSYARKYLKFPKKLRFRQAYFTVVANVVPNTIGDAAVRIYDITAFISQKETVVRETT